MPTNTSNTYIPGVCNINTAEIARRRKAGYLGSAIFIVVLVLLLISPFSRWFRLILILPGILAAIGFLQARNKFCVGFAAAGLQRADEDADDPVAIALQEAVAKDKRRARQLNQQAIGFGIVAGLLTLLIPVFNS